MDLSIKVRGIYATALTQFCVDNKFFIIDPSKEIRERFKNYKKMADQGSIDIEIRDLEDRQGVLLKGEERKLKEFSRMIQLSLFDAILREQKSEKSVLISIEFPYHSKSILDELRNRVTPTVPNHHRLRIIASEYVDLMEKIELSNHPEKREVVGKNLEERLIFSRFEKGKELKIEHVKLDGKVVFLSEGEIMGSKLNEKILILKRWKFKGRKNYDGLDIPKKQGDYAITEIKEGEWFYKHTYHRQDGTIIGEYYNINTKIEFYPDRIRYIDLEVDVVRWPDGRVEILEEDLLERRFREGFITQELANKVKEISFSLKEMLLK